jgi:hypothetical protein
MNMAQGPENYAGKLTAEEEAHILTLKRPDEIAEYLHQLELEAGLRAEDPMNNQILHELERPAAPQITSAITIDGKVYNFSGTQSEIDAQQAAVLRASFQSSEPTKLTTTNQTVARTADGRFAREEQRPNPSLTQGLDNVTNNLVTKALAEVGIDIDALKEAVAEKQAGRQEVSSWEQATRAFKEANPDYPGGEGMVELIAGKLQELGLTDQPSARSIQAAYDALVAEANLNEALQNAETPEDIKVILGTRAREEARIRRGNTY